MNPLEDGYLKQVAVEAEMETKLPREFSKNHFTRKCNALIHQGNSSSIYKG